MGTVLDIDGSPLADTGVGHSLGPYTFFFKIPPV